MCRADAFKPNTINPLITFLSQTLTKWCQWVFDDDSLVVWIEPCSPKDAEFKLKYLSMLAEFGAITGDELLFPNLTSKAPDLLAPISYNSKTAMA